MFRFFLIIVLLAAGLARAADPLATVAAGYREVDEIYTAEGMVEAVRQSTVSAQISGRIVEVKFDVGDAVRKGEVIVRIDEREVSDALASSQAQIAQAQAALRNAKANYERTQQLFKQSFVSQAALDRALSEFQAAQAQLQAAVAVASQAATVKGFATVTAPYGGIVAARHVELGEAVTPGKPLMTGFDPKDMRVVADVPQLKLVQIRNSSGADIEFPALGRRQKAGGITVLPTADPQTHTTRVRLVLPEYLQGTYPGMFARVHFAIGRTRRLLIPAQVVARRNEVTAVYVMGAEDVLHFRQVRLGQDFGAEGVEVLGGLQSGEKVALDPVKAAIVLKGSEGRR
jgi:RND family efflux transporter MFP subunit